MNIKRFYILKKNGIHYIFDNKRRNTNLFSIDDLKTIGFINNHSVVFTKSTSELLHMDFLLFSEYVIDITIFGNDLKSFNIIKNRGAFTIENAIELLDLIEENKYAAIY